MRTTEVEVETETPMVAPVREPMPLIIEAPIPVEIPAAEPAVLPNVTTPEKAGAG